MVVNGDDVLPVPRPAPRWKLRVVLALAVVAALVAGGLKAYDQWFVRCADGVRERGPDDECTGVTDGAYSFDDSLDDVTRRIHAENRRVGKSGKPWVSVAYLEPMTLGPGDKGRESIRQELEGAYLAQKRVNDPSGGQGDTPQLKLLPANPGRGSEQWSALVDQLSGMTGGDHPLVAVAGFGQSLDTTRRAVDALRERGVPMVGSTVTADQLSDPDELGFFRAVAPNSAQTSAMAKYLKGLQQSRKKGFRIQVVKDRNADDIYSASLLDGFDRAVRRAGLELDPDVLPFVSRGDALANSLESVADKICRQAELPDAVYFAGRGRDMKGLIEAVEGTGRECPVTLYTADDAVGLFFDLRADDNSAYERFRRKWERTGIRVQYTALAHPDASGDIYPGARANPFEPFRDAYAEEFGDADTQLLNGQAMLGHDAVLALGAAIRDAAGSDGRGKVNKNAVRELLVQLNGEHRLSGVSGQIDFDDAGNPRGKPLPLVELRPRAADEYAYLRVLKP
ncbi:ABC transporter substrate-binding protein [Streptomyces phytohabitans]|uniref:ABC transporter substrate-binding protein n=1 Tax=Streptomyces phytohabitans TaxID=1150371 RepID=UPI00345C2AB7